jgi:hypothetical protein
MRYLDDLGCETQENEYKVFTLNPLSMGKNDGFDLLKTGKWSFEDVVKPILKSYIKTYFPKYIATFSHPKTTVKNGSFYIGVDDDGIVHGIPYMGELNSDFIHKEILKNISSIRGANGKNCTDDYLKLVKVEIIKLDKKDCGDKLKNYNLDENFSSKIFNKLKNNKEIEDNKYKEYLKKKRDWERFFNSIPQKINEIVNDKRIRHQIIDLIKKTSTSTTKLCPKYKDIYGWCDIKNDYWSMIVDLKSDKIYEPITFESAEKIRNDKLSPIYWGLVWRDFKTTPSKFLKPNIYRHKYNYYKHYSLLMACQVPKMIPTWLKKNTELNLYLIKITLPGNISPELYLEYQDMNNQWIISYRTTVDGEPRCQPIL